MPVDAVRLFQLQQRCEVRGPRSSERSPLWEDACGITGTSLAMIRMARNLT
jgi:hypothetical protein